MMVIEWEGRFGFKWVLVMVESCDMKLIDREVIWLFVFRKG